MDKLVSSINSCKVSDVVTEKLEQNCSKPLLISEDVRLQILNFLRDKFSGTGGKCFFRRIETVIPKSEPVQITKFSSPEKFESLQSIKDLTFQEIDRYVEIIYRSFVCITSPRPVRYEKDPDEIENKEVFLHSNNYNQLDMSYDYTFDFSSGKENNSSKTKLDFPVTPCVGDLAFIYISNAELSKFGSTPKIVSETNSKSDLPNKNSSDGVKSGSVVSGTDVDSTSFGIDPKSSFARGETIIVEEAKKKTKKILPKATYWCVVSDQFLRAWTAIMFDWHETFDKLVGNSMNQQTINIVDSKLSGTFVKDCITVKDKNLVLREKLFVGNKLMTNSWLKRKLALKFNNLDFTENEMKERFWYMRSEYVAKRWIDVYCALVLIARYGELPCPINVPNNNDNEPKRHFWHLPEEFISMLFSRVLGGKNVTPDLIINHGLWMKNTRAKQNLLSKPYKGKVRLGFLDEIAKCRLSQGEYKEETFLKKPQIKKGSPKVVRQSDFPVTNIGQKDSSSSLKIECPINAIIVDGNSPSLRKIEERKAWVQVVKEKIVCESENSDLELLQESSAKSPSVGEIGHDSVKLLQESSTSVKHEADSEPKPEFKTVKSKKSKKKERIAKSWSTVSLISKSEPTESLKEIRKIQILESEYPKIGPKITFPESLEKPVDEVSCESLSLSNIPQNGTICREEVGSFTTNISMSTKSSESTEDKVTTIKIKEISLHSKNSNDKTSNKEVTSIKLELTIDVPKDKSWSQKILESKNDDDW